jgi:hypothetical protein
MMHERFIVLFCAVSGIAALAGWLLVEGAESSSAPLFAGGAIAGLIAALGIIVLARIVIDGERGSRR